MGVNRIKINSNTPVNTGIVYDISQVTKKTYINLIDALGENSSNIPLEIREGGMMIRFILTSTNQYMQYRLMNHTWSDNAGDWLSFDPLQQPGLSTILPMSQKAVTNQLNALNDNFNKLTFIDITKSQASASAVDLSLQMRQNAYHILDLTNHIYGTETLGVWEDSSTRILFLPGAVNEGDNIYIKTNSGYRFVITGYNVIVSSKEDITSEHFVEQYELYWVTEDTYVIPSAVKSIVIKVSRTDNGNIKSDNPTNMIDTAIVNADNNVQEDSFKLLTHILLEAATLQKAGIMSTAQVLLLNKLLSIKNFDLSNHIIGTETAGVWDDSRDDRILFFPGAVNQGEFVYVKTNSGYRFVITGYNVVVSSKDDITPSHFVEQYENSWVTEDTYVIPANVESVVIKVSRTDDDDITSDDPTGMIEIATLSSDTIDILNNKIDSVLSDIDSLDSLINGISETQNLNLSNHIYGTETLGVWEDSSTRILFLPGAVNQGESVYVKTNSGYRFVITGYNVIVSSKNDITAEHFVELYENSWVTEDTYTIPTNVRSVVIKVSRTDNRNIKSDDPTGMIGIATISTLDGLIYQLNRINSEIDGLTRKGLHIDYDGEMITLQKNNMLYSLFGNADDSFIENGARRAAEGLAVFKNYMFRFYINGLCKSFDISNGLPVLLSSFQLGSHGLNDNHCNCSQFANSIVSGNSFPYIYIANCVYPVCYVENITTQNSQLIQTITVNSSFSFRWCNVSAGDDGYLYAVGINCEANVIGTMKIIKFSLPSVSSANVTLTDQDAVDSFELAYDGNVHGLQGMEIRNGKIFLPMNGTANASQGVLRVIDIAQKKIQVDISISFHAYECEDVSVYDNEMYIGYYGSSSIYKLKF